MKNQLTNNQNGRFIKHNDPIRKHVNISDFNLMDVCEIPLAFADNPSSNVFHHKLHSQEDLNIAIHPMHDIDQVFEKERPPVIRPTDFTEDWKRMRRRIANRENRDDDDEIDLDFQSLIAKDYNEKRTETPSVKQHKTENPEILSTSEKREERRHQEIEEPQVISEKPSLEKHSHQSSIDTSFVPYFPETLPPTPQEPAISEEELEAIRESARQEGFQIGKNEGFDKGSLEAQEKYGRIFDELQKIIEELEGMQKSILVRSQENFLVLSQSLMEALLEREIKIHPESFHKIIQRAITDALPADDFKVVVSPDTVKSFDGSSEILTDKIKADDKLGPFQFRIESKLGVIDTKIKDIISNLLTQADLQIFEETEPDGKVS